LFEVSGDLSFNYIESLLHVIGAWSVHFVAADDDLPDTHGVSNKSVLSCLALFRPSRFELTSWRAYHKDCNISIGGTSYHIFDKISVSWGIDHVEYRFLGLELAAGDINGYTSFSLGLEFIEDPSILELGFAHFQGLIFVIFNSTLANTTTLVDQVTRGSGLTRVNMTDDDE
jgi:hypothetical protein